MNSLLYWAATFGASVLQLAAPPPAAPTPSVAPSAPAAPYGDAQPPQAAANEPQIEPTSSTPPAPARLSSESPVKLVIDETMASDRVSPGYRFAIYLADPVVLGGQTILPAGIRGEGEVIDAKHSSGGGAGGGIVVNARFLTCGMTRIALGKMHLATAGRNSVATAVATSAVVPLVGLFIRGHNAQIEKGTLADAKIISDVDVPAAC